MYEIDFHRVGDGDNSGDAISLRYFDGAQWRVIVIDGGYTANGEALCAHIEKWYGTSYIDHVISTHPDNDHMSGLRVVMEKMSVGTLWMHCPWAHTEQILPLFKSRRWLAANLTAELKRQYPMVQEMLDLAAAQSTPVYLPFAGQTIGPLTVLSPSREMYEGLLPQFRATPAPDLDQLQQLGHWLEGIRPHISTDESKNVYEYWDTETLLEGGTTAAENESSLIMLGDLPGRSILLTGDAGLVALREAANYAISIGKSIVQPGIFQVPHHGSRNNISPAWLNYIVGAPDVAGHRSPVTAVVSAGAQDTTHPRQVVVNAIQRRGAGPWSTKNGGLYFRGAGLPGRDWGDSAVLPFENWVERYS